jgi:hypothetical protein
MKQFEVRKFLIVPLEKMFPSQETSFQGSSLLDLSTKEPIQRTSSSLFGDGASNLVGVCGWQEVGQLRSLCD